jgi:excisionase family DNA binding protein
MSDRLLTTREVAERLAVSPDTVLRWHRSGKLPGGRRLGCNVLRFDAAEVEAWLEGMRVGPLDLRVGGGSRP